MKWLLTMSVDAIDIDAEEVIVSATEPKWWDCENIARSHGCEWWSLEALKEDD